MRSIIIGILLMGAVTLSAQQDSVIVKLTDLNPFESSELQAINQKRNELLEQYRAALAQLDKERSNKYAWIADKRNIDLTKIISIKEKEQEIVFVLKDTE